MAGRGNGKWDWLAGKTPRCQTVESPVQTFALIALDMQRFTIGLGNAEKQIFECREKWNSCGWKMMCARKTSAKVGCINLLLLQAIF